MGEIFVICTPVVVGIARQRDSNATVAFDFPDGAKAPHGLANPSTHVVARMKGRTARLRMSKETTSAAPKI
jgi:hypothetical protein